MWGLVDPISNKWMRFLVNLVEEVEKGYCPENNTILLLLTELLTYLFAYLWWYFEPAFIYLFMYPCTGKGAWP